MPAIVNPATEPSNGVLIRRLFGLAWRYRLHCVKVLSLQLVLLTMGVGGLSFTGLGIDYIRHEIQHTPEISAKGRLQFTCCPTTGRPLHVLALLAGLILMFALMRAGLELCLCRLGQQTGAAKTGRGSAWRGL